ncbi:hypothetical protein D3C72_1883740 [compost metagenome]
MYTVTRFAVVHCTRFLGDRTNSKHIKKTAVLLEGFDREKIVGKLLRIGSVIIQLCFGVTVPQNDQIDNMLIRSLVLQCINLKKRRLGPELQRRYT